MLYTLENEKIKLTLNAKGAEKRSIFGKKHGTEFLWNGDPAFWEDRAPVLFPIVGRLYNNTCRIDGNEYKMECHGFAQEMEFTVVKQDETNILLRLIANDYTKTMYPYDFVFDVSYLLDGNDIKIKYSITNAGTIDMPFAVGAHPGFMCPMGLGDAFTDYYLEFAQNETADILRVRTDGFFEEGSIPLLKNEKSIDLNYSLFANDALVFKNLKSDTVYLKSHKHNKHVKVQFGGFKYLGVWTRLNAPYVCIEPWTSLGDYYGYDGAFKDKPDMTALKPGGSFTISHIVSVYE